MKKKILLTEIIKFLGNDVKEVLGRPFKIEVQYLKDPQKVDEYTLDWINSGRLDKQQIIEKSKAKAIIVGSGIKYTNTLKKQEKVILEVENPKLAIAKIGNEFFMPKKEPYIHPTAIIHPNAKIGINVFIGPNTIIEKCIIGSNCTFLGNNYVDNNVLIGNNVEIHAGVIIGNEAHNFVLNEDGERYSFPHLGGVVIEDDVVLGANTFVSRGVLNNTIIGNGTKIAQLVVVGANDIIGSNCAIRANVMISGSVEIGDNAVLAPSVTVRDHRKIGVNAFIGMGAVVTKNIPAGEIWIGNPAKKIDR